MESIKLIKELSEIDGVSGFEFPVAEVYKKYLKDIVELKTDYMGNIMGSLAGTSPAPRIMVCSHLDELGLMVHSILEDGRVKFVVLTNWWDNIMLQQPVIIKTRKGNIPGIISSNSCFMGKTAEELKSFATKDAMFIDVGARNYKEVVEDFGIRPGDPVWPDVLFRPLANKEFFAGKAFDDRLGVAATIEIIHNIAGQKHPNTVLPVVTVQEEIGSRGAIAVTNFCKPDMAIILEGPPSDDIPLKPYQSQCIPGKGVHIRRMEPGMMSNGGFFKFIVSIAEELNIPHQIAVSQTGATDGALIHREAFGIPSIMIGIPVRYAHASHGVFCMEDYKNTVKLLTEVLLRLDTEVLERIKENPYG
ncbi:MAG TPA: M42 family metallopeptidase [Candidatus Eremiobacteraeota bacterium]|nr:M42 family metallopeptidase [Candidatus Eremiobacteraeota bacterium]